ncbi:hypothetical protein COCVIDRAFT_117210, partial [Bipolaris victoriae FI3]
IKIVRRNLIVLIKTRARITELAQLTKVFIKNIILEKILFTSKYITNLKNYT